MRLRRSTVFTARPALGPDAVGVAPNGCDNNWSTWWIGSRTQWNVTKDFYMGVDVLYSKLRPRAAIQLPVLGTLLCPVTSSAARPVVLA